MSCTLIFFPQQKTETGRDEGFFQVKKEEEEEWCLAHASIIFSSIKKKKNPEWVGSSSGKSASLHAVIKLLSGLWTMFQLHVCVTH